ncbi:protein FAM47E [Sorex fumeus]|uniref:protein FAM47E n=1 Tax=Sorex fumeus TaxID=62283 RepID=UPI0024AD0A18|nr:protein FAM47E [Sorex fumeus]
MQKPPALVDSLSYWPVALGRVSSRYRESAPRTDPTWRWSRKRPTALNSRRWVFVTGGPDGFRQGCPQSGPGLGEGFLPRIHHGAPQPTPKKSQKAQPKAAEAFPRLAPAQNVQEHLSGQLWARCPEVEDLPVELLLKVLQVLDPDRKLKSMWASSHDISKKRKEPTIFLKQDSTLVYPEHTKETSASHSHSWLYKEKTSETDSQREDRPCLPESVRKEVSDFCNWASTFGSLSIDEEFILKQFDVDYRNETSSDVLHVMKLNQVPLMLKKSGRLTKMQEPGLCQKPDHEQKLQTLQNPCKPKWVKMRYGAWYLNTKLWKKQRADEPLVDPKVLLKAQDENVRKELQEQEKLLGDLHGAAAFKEFIRSRGYRMPRFLEKMEIRKESKKCHETPLK